MSKFGWSYPAGCSGPPDDGRGPSELVEQVLGLLEEAGIDTETNDAVVALVEKAETRLAERAMREYWEQPSLRDMRTTTGDAVEQQTCVCGHHLSEHVSGRWECLALDCPGGCPKFRPA